MVKRCRLCNQTVVDHSIFCADHRRQAANFSVAFGQPEEGAAAEATEGETSQASVDRAAGTPERAEFETLVADALDQVVAWNNSRRDEDAQRFPQLSTYYLNECWHARPYYAIVPRPDPEAEATSSFDMNQAVHAFKPGKPVFEAFAEQFAELARDLKSQAIQSLDVHFVTYAGVIAINAHTPEMPDRNLAAFVVGGDSVVAVELEDVRGRLRRTRW